MKQLLILSGKGGTGKTTVASAFIRLGQAKAYADCDVDAPNLHLIMHHDQEPQRENYYGLPKAEISSDLCIKCGRCLQECRFEAIFFNQEYQVDSYACEGCGVCEQICPVGAISLQPAIAGELMLYRNAAAFSTARLKMGSGTSGMLVTRVKKQLQDVVDENELAIIDGSPGIGCPVIASLSGVELVLMVAEPSVSGISDMERVIETAERFKTKIAVCINKYDVNLENTRKIEEYCQQKKLSVVGKIPYDKNVLKAVNRGESIADLNCDAGQAVQKVFQATMTML